MRFWELVFHMKGKGEEKKVHVQTLLLFGVAKSEKVWCNTLYRWDFIFQECKSFLGLAISLNALHSCSYSLQFSKN